MSSNWTPSQNSLFHNTLDDPIENNLNIDYVQKFSECNEFIFLDHCKDQENQIQNIFSETQSNGQQNPQGLFYQQNDLNHPSNNQTQKDSTTGSQNGKTSTQEQEQSNYPPSVDSLKFPKLQKRIKKQYQPLYDNEMVYDYNVDPEEYKKARKRIQNRQSATRIRHRKANNFQSLESQFEDAIKRNTELMLENARLQAENNLLQQQLQFLQKILMKERNESLSQPENINMHQFPQDQNQQQYVLPVSQVSQEPMQQKEMTPNLWTKIPGNNQGKENRNLTFLGMMTMIFCCIAFFSTSAQDGKLLQIGKNQIDMTDPEKVGELFKQFELQPKSQDPQSDQQTLANAKEIFIATLIQQIVNKYNNKHQIIFEILEIGFLIIYCVFIIFVGVKLVVNYWQESKKVKIKIS